ncbi:MAG TPA: hypothetical protein PKJ45_05425 [Rubrivivax sp.]|nr:hypothetical protein [Rubrivivax sp.]
MKASEDSGKPSPASKPAGAAAKRPALGGTFLSGATGRLLPASVPFRYFGAALVFHLAAWLVVLLTAPDWPEWRGGLGWPLAALHLVTLGTLAASAIGVSLQLLPVATRESVHRPGLLGLIWWIYVPGVVVLVAGMGMARPQWLGIGAAALIAVLSIFALMFALNLRAGRSMVGVVLHGAGAFVALLLVLASAAALVALWLGHPVFPHAGARDIHLAAGVFGFMGLLAFGLSFVLLPMFALGRVPGDRQQLQGGCTALAAVTLALAAGFVPEFARVLQGLALLVGAIALALHLRMMRGVFATAMRRDLGISGRLMKAGWAGLAIALPVGAAALVAGAGSNWGLLFGLAAVGGWLLTFLFGILQRILPFLASMHAGQKLKRGPTPSALTQEQPLRWHALAHGLALLLLAAGMAFSSVTLIRLAGLAGTLGALSFLGFFAVLLQRLLGALRAPSA